ncbi:NAD(P)/FAD-dependent oxidoreductase [Sphingomonas sp.]|uniref:NAD(P)/FAD-dependent oxidoreductase n=1 Tax=Sphingomonas sp. TaxID=28214 RepID=UPI0035BBA21B
MRRTPALIVGGGPAGAAAAIVLARARAPHLLVERTRETGDALCGGFLSWQTLRTLAELGIAADTLSPARLSRVRIVAGHRQIEAALPAPAVSVSRHRLDTVMLAHAVATGAAVERGVAVRSIDAREARTADGAPIAADTLFLASGKHDIRGTARPEDARGRDPTLGLRVRLAPSPALTRLVNDAVELHLFRGGYAGIALQEDGSANVCMAVHRSRMQAAGGPAALLRALGDALPHLGERLASWDGSAPDAIANVPYGWRARSTAAGVFRLGDQAAVIPSLAGEGMGIAIASGCSAAAAHLHGGSAERWQPAFARSVAPPMLAAGTLRRLAESRAAPALLPLLRPSLIRISADATRIVRVIA